MILTYFWLCVCMYIISGMQLILARSVWRWRCRVASVASADRRSMRQRTNGQLGRVVSSCGEEGWMMIYVEMNVFWRGELTVEAGRCWRLRRSIDEGRPPSASWSCSRYMAPVDSCSGTSVGDERGRSVVVHSWCLRLIEGRLAEHVQCVCVCVCVMHDLGSALSQFDNGRELRILIRNVWNLDVSLPAPSSSIQCRPRSQTAAGTRAGEWDGVCVCWSLKDSVRAFLLIILNYYLFYYHYLYIYLYDQQNSIKKKILSEPQHKLQW